MISTTDGVQQRAVVGGAEVRVLPASPRVGEAFDRTNGQMNGRRTMKQAALFANCQWRIDFRPC
jgi:hypothetical protein